MAIDSYSPTTYSACRFETIAHGVIEAIFIKSSVSAVDEFVQQLGPLLRDGDDKITLHLSVNIARTEQLPVVYFMQQTRHLFERSPVSRLTTVAFLSSGNRPIEVRFLRPSILAAPWNHTTRFYDEQLRSQAVHWLM